MRKWFASLAVLGLATAAATAQTIPVPPVGGCGQSQSLFFDTGPAVTSWKVFYPTGAGDVFSVDFDDQAGNMTVTGVAMNTWVNSSTGPIGISYVMVAPDNAIDTTGHTPDINSSLSILGSLSGTVTITGSPTVASGFCPAYVGYDLPDVAIPTTGGLHAAMNFLTGDSGSWLCSDTSAPDGRSYFSFNDYSTPGTALGGHDLMMRVIGEVNTGSGSAYVTVNNSANEVDVHQTQLVTTTLWSNCGIQPTLYVQGITIPYYGFFLVPSLTLSTGYENGSPIADSTQGTLCDVLSDPSTGPCVPAPLTVAFSAFYLDNCDLKKNGKPKLKSTNSVTVNVVPNPAACNPCFCFGQADDGSLDSTIWKVQNPAGSKDYFNSNVGTMIDPNTSGPCPQVSSVVSIAICSWDFCGNGPSWASVGLYEGTTIDPDGTPDLGNAIFTATSLAMAPNAADWSYPGTTYDGTDVYVSTSSALAGLGDAHVAAEWASADTCTWLASDTDGGDDAGPSDSCSVIPSTQSYFTLNGYTTNAIPFTATNWMMKINYQ